LAFGPAGLAQIADARRHGWGLVVDDPAPARLAEALRTLLGDRDLRRRLSAAAQALALARHDIASVRARFQQVLIDAAGEASDRETPSAAAEAVPAR
jgi:hypothetical protein